MSTAVTYVGNQYNVPAYQDTGYAQGTGNLSSYLIALATGSLTLSGGSFPLTADADFGGSFGLKAIYFKSRSSNIASAGIFRLANAENIGWRNTGNTDDLLLTVGSGATSPLTATLNQNTSTQFVVKNTSNGTGAIAALSADNGTNSFSLQMMGTGNTSTEFGITLANYGLFRTGSTASGLMIGTGGGSMYFGTVDTLALTIDTNQMATFTNDVKISGSGKGFVVTTPDGSKTFRIYVDNNGELTALELT